MIFSVLFILLPLVFIVAVFGSLFVKQDGDAIDRKYAAHGFLRGFISHHPVVFWCFTLGLGVNALFVFVIWMMVGDGLWYVAVFLLQWCIILLFLYSIYQLKRALGHRQSRRTVSRFVALGFCVLAAPIIWMPHRAAGIFYQLLAIYIGLICLWGPAYKIYCLCKYGWHAAPPLAGSADSAPENTGENKIAQRCPDKSASEFEKSPNSK